MAKKVRKVLVSRSGLTTCPSCLSHIQIAASLEETSCPFCGAELVAEVKRSPIFGHGVHKALNLGKSGLLMASLIGVPAVAGCDDEEDPEPDMMMVEEDMAQEPGLTPDYGVEPFDEDQGTVVEEDMAQEPGVTPDYGVEPPDMG